MAHLQDQFDSHDFKLKIFKSNFQDEFDNGYSKFFVKTSCPLIYNTLITKISRKNPPNIFCYFEVKFEEFAFSENAMPKKFLKVNVKFEDNEIQKIVSALNFTKKLNLTLPT